MTILDFAQLDIGTPKRSKVGQTGWEGFFPYYAGFPEAFAERILRSAKLSAGSLILDPWNGSGTTTYAASRLGLRSIGIDVNPVMAIVARARTLPPTERDSLVSLGKEIVDRSTRDAEAIAAADPLLQWFGPKTASSIRRIEKSAREVLLSEQTRSAPGSFEDISAIASTFYVALFSVARATASTYRTSNPTWIRNHKAGQRRVSRTEGAIGMAFLDVLAEMAGALVPTELPAQSRGRASIHVADTSQNLTLSRPADLILTSPPYCTRLDYTAATRIQLAILAPIMTLSQGELSRLMTGSVRVPKSPPMPQEAWGRECNEFLSKVKAHPSKASSGYYYKNHADYFEKMFNSLRNLSKNLANNGVAILVAQDSHYKNVHNDLPAILVEMASSHSLALRRRENFPLAHTMAGSHPHTKNYRSASSAVESVLCFQKR